MPSLVGFALATPGIVGYGPRIPANMLFAADRSVSLAVLDTHRAYSSARGKLFKPRVIWGKYTPSWAMGTRISGFAGPTPYLKGGGPNITFEAAQKKLAEAIAAWSVGRDDVVEYDCGWYSLNYSELYNGPEIQTAYGASPALARDRFITAHKRIMDINHTACSPAGLPVGFGLSGHGPITEISGALADHATRKPLGSIFVQANGWGQEGEWGGAGEAGQDKEVWQDCKGKVTVAVQDISAKAPRTAAQVKKMWDNLKTLQADRVLVVYNESYFYQWDNGTGKFHADAAAFAEFRRQIAAFVPAGIPGDENEEELDALRAQLAALEAQLPPLEAEVSADAQAEGDALAAYQQAQAEAIDSETRFAALNAEIEAVRQQIEGIGG